MGPSGEVHSYLFTLREAADLTQWELAKRLGSSERAIRNYERGVHSPDYEMLVKIAHELCRGPRQQDLLFTLAGFHGVPPEVFPSDEHALESYLRDYAEEVRDSPHPAFIRDAAWYVLAANSAFERFILAVTGEQQVEPVGWNIFINVVFNPAAPRRLGNWNRQFRLPILCQLANELRAIPDNPELRLLEEAVTSDPDTFKVYQEIPRHMQSIEHAVHFDGARLPLSAGDLSALKVKVRKPLAWQHRGLREVRWVVST